MDNDLISREALKRDLIDNYSFFPSIVKNALEKQPTISPDSLRPKGRWTLNRDGSGTCSECHRTRKDVWDMDTWDNYCSHCGAEMREIEK